MPKGDKTGPNSQGPMTGRAAGYCTGHSVPGFINPNRGFGRGLARRRGRGWGRGFGGRWNIPAYQPIAQPVPTPFSRTRGCSFRKLSKTTRSRKRRNQTRS